MPIFVAGTGRSGTTRLAQQLGTHPEVFTIAGEGRFLIDPGGLEDLVASLTDRYTTFHAADAIRRFGDLTRSVLGCEGDYAWRKVDTDADPHGQRCLERFLEQLIDFRFEEDHPEGPREIEVGRYFPDRAEVVGLAREFLEELFGSARDTAGKRFWCEKTPYNLLSMPFLWELFPDAVIVHIKRDPRGVANSMVHQWWAPDDIGTVIRWLDGLYRRWLDLKPRVDFRDRCYLEVRVEDLAADPASRDHMLEAIGLPPAPLDGWFDRRVNWWDGPDGMPDEWRTRVEGELGWAIEAMGYGED